MAIETSSVRIATEIGIDIGRQASSTDRVVRAALQALLRSRSGDHEHVADWRNAPRPRGRMGLSLLIRPTAFLARQQRDAPARHDAFLHRCAGWR